MADYERRLETTTVEESEASGVKVVGAQRWVTITKAWSEKERWMKSTKAMQIPGGVLIQVTTNEPQGLAEALTFVPGVCVEVDDATGLGILYSQEDV